MIAYLRGLFPVRREERGIVWLLYALLTLTVVANWVGKVGTNSIFIKQVGVSYLPIAYVLAPLTLLAASTLIFSLVGRMRRRDLLVWYIGFVCVVSIATQAALQFGGVDLWWAYVLAQVVKDTIYLIFWMYAGNLFDSEQGKRIFPLFAGALLVGKIAGGVIAGALTPIIHSEYFLAVQGAGFALAFVLVVLYRGRLPEGEGAVVAEKAGPRGLGQRFGGALDGYRAVAGDRLLRPFGLSIFLWYFLMQIANYLYSAGLDAATQATSVQGAEDAYTLLYASVYTSGSLIALAVQTFLTGGLIRRLGVSLVLFAFPLWYLVTYGAGAIFGLTVVIAIALQAGERIIVPALHLPATQVVFNQVAAGVRPRARAFFSGGLNAIGEIAAAGVLIAGAITANAGAVLAFGTACSAIFAANTIVVRRALGRRIAENLRSEDPELRRNAAQMLRGEGRAVRTDQLREVLTDASADIENRVRVVLSQRGALLDVTE